MAEPNQDDSGSEKPPAEEIQTGLPDSRDYEVPALVSDRLVLFPAIEVITVVNDDSSIAALREALKQHQILACIPSSSRETPGSIGTLAMVKHSGVVVGGTGMSVELKGLWRIRVKKLFDSSGFSKVQFEKADETMAAVSPDASSLMNKVQGNIDEFVRLIPGIPLEIVSLLKSAKTPGQLADICANSPDLSHEERVELLETLDQMERLKKVSKLLDEQLVTLRKAVKTEPISRCEKCMELADSAFESDPTRRAEIAVSFLNHVVRDHPGELLALLAEKYGPIFLNRRSLR
jgi:ATP-dependent Lon protease